MKIIRVTGFSGMIAQGIPYPGGCRKPDRPNRTRPDPGWISYPCRSSRSPIIVLQERYEVEDLKRTEPDNHAIVKPIPILDQKS